MTDMSVTALEFLNRRTAKHPLTPSPKTFAGTLDDLCERYVLPNLPSSKVVEAWHKLLVEYTALRNSLLLIRYMRGTNRGEIYRTKEGHAFKATDNAPAWWFHFAVFQELVPRLEEFASIVPTIPTHIFEIASQLPVNMNKAGWHVAHVFDVKTGDTNYHDWRRRELVSRFLRNVHPCNYFFVPKVDWQKWGGEERVIGYFVQLYQERYANVWPEFVKLSQGDISRISRVSGPISYQYESPVSSKSSRSWIGSERNRSTVEGSQSPRYRASRLTFKADVIEALQPGQAFEVETPEGVFEMTKEDFYRVFPNVVASRSYREGRLYNYSKTPGTALQFLKDETSDG